MAAIYDYTGVVETVLEKQTFSSGFTKRDLIVTDDVDSPSKYPNHLPFTFKKDNCALLDNVHQGQRVKVHFAVDGRAWQDPKTGKNRYFVDLTALKLEILNGDGSSTEPVPEAPEAPDTVAASVAEDADDLPF